MSPPRAATGLSEAAVKAVERVVAAAIGLTSLALGDASPTELTLQQWRALVVVGDAEPLRVGALAARIGTTLTATSRLVSRLERRGLLETARDETDRRATNIRLTPKGRAVRNAVLERRHELLIEALQLEPEGLPAGVERALDAIARAFDRYT